MHSIWMVWVYVALAFALSVALVGCAGAGDSAQHPIYAHCI